ncbi:cytochrome P450 3A14-like, partial [Rhipicephalus sanguineus]|uniref:cytochrome P450 3A14-like n=1 Tax=Rhipicephalus sanguineus TaxID=34632 RepID=UPI0020C1E509
MTKETARVIDLRRKNPEFRKPDVLQSLLDAEYQEESSETENSTSAKGKGPANLPKSRVLTKDEVLLNACTLFLAGYDTTSTSLSYLTYLLAKHQDVQDRVRKEINDAVSSTEELDYETVTRKLPYLSQVVNEALRLYPPVLTFVSRKALNDFEYKGVHYKAGTGFMSSTLHIHRDARYWPDPH